MTLAIILTAIVIWMLLLTGAVITIIWWLKDGADAAVAFLEQGER